MVKRVLASLHTPCPPATPFLTKTLLPHWSLLCCRWDESYTKERDISKGAQKSVTKLGTKPGLLQVVSAVPTKCGSHCVHVAWTYIKYNNPKSWWSTSAPVLFHVKSSSCSCVPFFTLCLCTQVQNESQLHAFQYIMPHFFSSGRKLSSAVQLWCCKDSVWYQYHITEPGLHPVCRKTARCRQMWPIRVRLFLIAGFKINTAIKSPMSVMFTLQYIH